ncbi:MAG: hypothetical protein JWL64_2225, partial [Frankiales bacterium]|nr:hypothetical protein [Frankiales bacterium]
AAAALVPGAAALVPDPLLAEPAPAGPLTDPAALSFAELSTAIGATEAPPVPVVFEDAVLPADKVLDELAAAGYDEDDELAGDEPADESPEEFEAAAAPGVEAGSLPDQEHSASDASSAAQQAPADEPAVAAVAVDEDGEPVAGAVGTDAQRLEAEPAAATPQPAVDEPSPGEDVVADEEPPAVAPAHRPHTQTVDSWPQLSDPATPEPFEQVPDVQADPAVQAEQVPDVYAEPAVQAEQAVEAEQVPDVHAELAVQAEPAASEPLDRADTGEPADPSVASATEPLPHPVPSPARFSVPPSPELDEAVGESVRAARPIRPAVTGGMAPPRQRPAVPSRENQTDPAAPSGSAAADDEDGDGRRRPWWRPGG